MLADRPTRQSLVAQVDQEGLEIRDDLPAWQKIFGQSHPASRPLIQLLAEGSQGACWTGTTSFTVVGFAFGAMRWN